MEVLLLNEYISCQVSIHVCKQLNFTNMHDVPLTLVRHILVSMEFTFVSIYYNNHCLNIIFLWSICAWPSYTSFIARDNNMTFPAARFLLHSACIYWFATFVYRWCIKGRYNNQPINLLQHNHTSHGNFLQSAYTTITACICLRDHWPFKDKDPFWCSIILNMNNVVFRVFARMSYIIVIYQNVHWSS